MSDHQPTTMTVSIRDRSQELPWGHGPTNPRVREVTISAFCPQCGGQRGDVRTERQHDDGVTYYVSRWSNPCGHLDRYVDVADEAHALWLDSLDLSEAERVALFKVVELHEGRVGEMSVPVTDDEADHLVGLGLAIRLERGDDGRHKLAMSGMGRAWVDRASFLLAAGGAQ